MLEIVTAGLDRGHRPLRWRGRWLAAADPSSDPDRTARPVSPFDRLGRFVVRRARLVIGAWAVLLARSRCRSRRRRPGRSAPAASSSTTSSRPGPRRSSRRSSASPPSALVVVFSSPTLRGRRRRRSRPPPPRRSRDVPTAPHVAGVVLAHARSRARSRPTATPPTTSSCSTCRPTTRRRRCPDPARALARRARARGRAGRRPGVLRRRPGGLRARPPAQRAHLAAARRARAAARVRLASSRRACRSSSAARRSSSPSPAIFVVASVDADEHLRAQPRDAARARASASTTRCCMTSRFREELARAAGGDPDARRARPSRRPSRRPAGPCSSAA